MMFDLDKKSSAEAEPLNESESPYSYERTKAEIKREKQRAFNSRQKSFARLVGENLASYVCICIAILVISLVWVEIGATLFTPYLFFDALLTIVLFVIAEYCMAQMGTKGGKLDADYVKYHDEYLELRRHIVGLGISLMERFCEAQVDAEYEYYVRKRCKRIKLDYALYLERFADKSADEIKKLLPAHRALAVIAINEIKPIELNADILLTDGKVKSERGGVPISGEEYVENHTTGWRHVAISILLGLITVLPKFSPTGDVTVGRIIYTIFKLSMLTYRMFKGYSGGAKAFNTVELKHLQAKTKYLHLYEEFLSADREQTAQDPSQ